MSNCVPIPMPVAELCDRLTIAKIRLKKLSLTSAEYDLLRAQISYYEKGVAADDAVLHHLLATLLEINSSGWDAEAALKAGVDDGATLDAIGRRALHIREVNFRRVAIKNAISAHVQQPEFTEIKRYHMSESTRSATSSTTLSSDIADSSLR